MRRPEGWRLKVDPRTGIFSVRFRFESKRYDISTGLRSSVDAAVAAERIYTSTTGSVDGRSHPSVLGTIYFAEAVSTGLVKIGWTSGAIDARLRSLKTSSPHHLRVIAAAPGTQKDERSLHVKFASSRVRQDGEWFERAGEIDLFLMSIVRAK